MLLQTPLSLLAPLLLISTPASAAPPFPIVQNGIVPRAGNTSVYVCDDVFWSGNCARYPYPLGTDECTQLNGKASSIGPDKGVTCTFYKNGVCRSFQRDDTLTLVHPGANNLLLTEKGDFNDAVWSFKCFDKQ
ncbi:hypothetical protein DM02DRAFT_622574 [Periconia macrospinosa]|uniref:Uncharacterized protein n=1 Tax=Periconia macrospinosa TaxID=97972 RepID=A0A2V1EAN8_9PLEO|nr:hypothetical protein DM02DRAFT_622574 [Periconia macrospinosa]